MNTKTIAVFALILVLLVLAAQPVTAGALKWIVIGGKVVVPATGGYLATVFSLEKTVNLVEVDLEDDVKNNTLEENHRYVLDPDEAPDDPQRNIFIHSSKPIRSLGGDTLLFKIKADEYDGISTINPTRFTIEGPLISKLGYSPKSVQIAYGSTGTFRFDGLMTVILNKPDWEISAVGIEGFTVTFEKEALAGLIQSIESPEKKAKEVAKTLGTNKGTKTPPKPPDSSTPPDDDSPDKEPPDTGDKPVEQKPTSDEWYIIG